MTTIAKPAASRPLEGALLKWFFKPAVVLDVEQLSANFRLVTLAAPVFETPWPLGSKLQIAFGGLSTRTFTPLAADGAHVQFVTYLHGDAPASRWAAELARGDSCHIFGPRRSLNLSDLTYPALLFGDETAFGLARSMSETAPIGGMSWLFEVNDIGESKAVLDMLGIDRPILVARQHDDAHLEALAQSLLEVVAEQGPYHFILTGKAPSIQKLNRALRSHGILSSQLRTKAYWAPGKTGWIDPIRRRAGRRGQKTGVSNPGFIVLAVWNYSNL